MARRRPRVEVTPAFYGAGRPGSSKATSVAEVVRHAHADLATLKEKVGLHKEFVAVMTALRDREKGHKVAR
jgi:hypothetical protein